MATAQDVVHYIDGHLREPTLTPSSIAETFETAGRAKVPVVVSHH